MGEMGCGSYDRSLEEMIEECLSSWMGDRSKSAARWVVSGEPSNFDLSWRNNGWVPPLYSKELLERAAAHPDPDVLWRLGEVIARPIEGPLVPIALYSHLYVWAEPTDERIADILAKKGLGAVDLIQAAFAPDFSSQQFWKQRLRSRRLVARMVHDHPEAVAAMLLRNTNEVEQVAELLLETVEASGEAVLDPLAPTIAELVTDSGKRRRAAGALLSTVVDRVVLVPQFKRLVIEGKAPVRAEALKWWALSVQGKQVREILEFCDEHLAKDRSSAVQAVIAELRESAADQQTEADVAVAWPEVDQSEPGEAGRRALVGAFERGFDEAVAHYEKLLDMFTAQTPQTLVPIREPKPPQPVPPEEFERCWEYVCTGQWPSHKVRFWSLDIRLTDEDCRPFSALGIFRLAQVRHFSVDPVITFRVLRDRYRQTGHPTLLEVQAAAEMAGAERDFLIRQWRFDWFAHWGAESVGEWASALQSDLTARIESGSSPANDKIDKYYEVAATMPVLPPQLRKILQTQAVGSAQGLRPLARATLGNTPEAVSTAVEYLSSRKFDERAAAATWLAELGAKESLADLQRAAEAEKHQGALDAELAAIELLGGSTESFFDRESLVASAVQDLRKKGMPKDGEWIEIGILPELRWDDGSEVDPVLKEWMVVQAVRAKSPVPTPIIRQIFERIEPATARRFASALIESWIDADLRTIPLDAATELAKRDTFLAQRFQQYPDLTDDEIFARSMESHASTPAGSAVGSKGLLSLVVAGGGVEVVPPAEAYVRTWYGTRLSQSKALVEALGWLDNPFATQSLLSIAARFRTKGIKQEAAHQAELLAERKGWTLDELIRRSAPDGGFGADGTLLLDYGAQRFIAALSDEVEIVLSASDGTPLSALPEPGPTDDPMMVDEAKRKLLAARFEVDAVLREQPLLWRETDAWWFGFPPEEFNRYVLENPVLRRLASRWVWEAEFADGHVDFRPLSDGTLIDIDDNNVDLTTAVTVAMNALPPKRWRSHFHDYGIVGLFKSYR